MARDDLDERVRRAAQTDAVTIDRVTRAALESHGTPHAARPRAFAALGTTLAAVVMLAVWWSARAPVSVPAGVFRIEAVAGVSAEASEVASSMPPPPGVYRATADATLAPARVMRVRAGDGTIWILSTGANDEWLPPGTGIVVGGGE